MAKHVFAAAERFAVWKTYEASCYWCGEPLEYKHATVDHVIPESLDGTLDAKLREQYALGAEFTLNDFCNWVPAHSSCNARKSRTLYTASPAFIGWLHDAQKNAPRARRIHDQVLSDRRKGELLGRIEAAVQGQAVSRDEIIGLLRDVEPASKSTEKLHDLLIPVEWTVVRVEDGLAHVSNGQYFGVTPTGPNPHHSWDCPNCGNRGPWNGVICLSCGRRSDPYD